MPKIGKKNKFRCSHLWYAVKYNNVKMVETLLDTGAKVNEECGRDRETVLHLAAKKGYTEIVKLLLEFGADLKKRDRFGNTPLHSGASKENAALVLLKHNADVNAKNAFRETPLHHAGSAIVVYSMIAKKVVDINAQDRNGETAFFRAFKRRCSAVLIALYLEGAKTNLENKYGEILEVDNIKLKKFGILGALTRTVVNPNGRRKCMYLEETAFARLASGDKLESGQHRVKIPSYCDVLKAAKRNATHEPNDKSLSRILVKPIIFEIKYPQKHFKGNISRGQSSNVRVKRKDKSLSGTLAGIKCPQKHFKGDISCGQPSNVHVRRNDKNVLASAVPFKKAKKRNNRSERKNDKKLLASAVPLKNEKRNYRSERNRVKRSKHYWAKQRTFKPKTWSSAIEENEAWILEQEEKSEMWYRAQDKKKCKQREEIVVDKGARRKRKTRFNSIGAYRNVSDMIRSQEIDYYEARYFAVQGARRYWMKWCYDMGLL